MFSKKLTAVLVAVGVVASTSALFNATNIKGAFAETIKNNVVYTKSDASAVSKDDTKVSSDEEEAYKKKSLDIVKKYFDISFEENNKFEFTASKSNEKTYDEKKLEDQKNIQASYDNKKMSKENYDKSMVMIEEEYSSLKGDLAKIKHGTVDTVGFEGEKVFEVHFNENTKEVDSIFAGIVKQKESDANGIPKDSSDTPLTISEDKLKNTAEDFLKQNKLGDIEKPKCILVKGTNLFYQDEKDSTKKVKIGIDAFTGKVNSFSVKTYADWEYDEAINTK